MSDYREPDRIEISEEKVEVAIIGAGPGGYIAAIRLADLGKQVVLID